MNIPTLDGITRKTVTTERLTTRVLFTGPEDGAPVLFVHGNLSSATWWEDVMLALRGPFRGIAPDQRAYGGADPDKKIDATRGMGDLSDDLRALLNHLNIEKAHIVGHSMGGAVLWRMLGDYPERFLSATVVAPGSPFGFGGTKDAEGAPCYADFAGSGAGLIHPESARRLAAADRSDESPFSPRNLLAQIVKSRAMSGREEALLSSLLATHLGQYDYPGDTESSSNWPHFAPGVWGINNALSPKYAGDAAPLYAINPKPAIFWIRGSDDNIVSDQALGDAGTLGMMGFIPGWPGADVFPPQPMVSQTRAVLEKYAETGGEYEEVVIEDAGHTPYIDKPDEFNAILHARIS